MYFISFYPTGILNHVTCKQLIDGLSHRFQYGFANHAQDSHCWHVRRWSHRGAPALDPCPLGVGVGELPVATGASERLWRLYHPGDGSVQLWPNWACCVRRWLHGAARCVHIPGARVRWKWHVVNVPTQPVRCLQPGAGEIASELLQLHWIYSTAGY